MEMRINRIISIVFCMLSISACSMSRWERESTYSDVSLTAVEDATNTVEEVSGDSTTTDSATTEVPLVSDPSSISSSTYPTAAQAGAVEEVPSETVTEVTIDSSLTDTSTQSGGDELNQSDAVTNSTDESDESNVSDAAVSSFDWKRVLITEVVTDPQQDHGESQSGNGIKFDLVPGSGTIGSTDEYIEIFNGTDNNVDVSAWSLNMADGTDVTELLADDSWEEYFSASGNAAQFAPGEFLVLGNPSGTINNTITITLFDENNEVIDEVDVSDANAGSLDDEAYYRDPDGNWLQGIASPGTFPDL